MSEQRVSWGDGSEAYRSAADTLKFDCRCGRSYMAGIHAMGLDRAPADPEYQAVFRGPASEYETLKRVALALGFEAVEATRRTS